MFESSTPAYSKIPKVQPGIPAELWARLPNGTKTAVTNYDIAVVAHEAAARSLVSDRTAFLSSAAASDDLSADIDILKKANFEWLANATALAGTFASVIQGVFDAWKTLCTDAQAAELARYNAVIKVGTDAGLAADAVSPAGDSAFQALEAERILVCDHAKAAQPCSFLRIENFWNAQLRESILRELPAQDFLSEFK